MSPIILDMLRKAVPYLIAAAVGFGGAWHIQGLRITAVALEFERYKIDQADALIKAEQIAERQRKESSHAYREKQTELEQQVAKGDAYRRCVAAGKCGARAVRLPEQSAGTDIRLPTGAGTDAAGADAVPAGREPAPEVIGDCANSTLRLNELQSAIEAQAGY